MQKKYDARVIGSVFDGEKYTYFIAVYDGDIVVYRKNSTFNKKPFQEDLGAEMEKAKNEASVVEERRRHKGKNER